ncbi:MAG: hypothetical protein Q9162_001872 [Coniocarpon cinnabarinum]
MVILALSQIRPRQLLVPYDSDAFQQALDESLRVSGLDRRRPASSHLSQVTDAARSTHAYFPTHSQTEGDPSKPIRPFEYDFFAIDYTLYNNILVVNNASIELRSSIASLVSHETRTTINARVSSPRGITPAWWPFGDGAELHWQGEQAYAGLPITVRRQFDDLTHFFELRPDLTSLPSSLFPSNLSELTPPTVDALIRLRWDENRISEEHNTIECVVSESPYSQSPSHTYTARKWMLPLIKGPLKFVVETYARLIETVFAALGQVGGTIILYIYFAALSAVLAWFGSGRPSAESIIRATNRRMKLQRLESVSRRLEDLRIHEADQYGSLRLSLILSAITGRSHRDVPEARRKRLADKVDLEKGRSLD